MNIFKTVKKWYSLFRNPVAYWRSKGAVIGEGCEIYPTVAFGSEPYLVQIGDHVRLSGGIRIITHDGGVWVLRHMKEEYKDIDIFAGVKIGNNVHVGTGVTIMPGVTIGSNVIIGCDAVVTKDIPDNSIAVGVPAKVVQTIEEYENKHINDFVHTKTMSSAEKRAYILQKIQKNREE